MSEQSKDITKVIEFVFQGEKQFKLQLLHKMDGLTLNSQGKGWFLRYELIENNNDLENSDEYQLLDQQKQVEKKHQDSQNLIQLISEQKIEKPLQKIQPNSKQKNTGQIRKQSQLQIQLENDSSDDVNSNDTFENFSTEQKVENVSVVINLQNNKETVNQAIFREQAIKKEQHDQKINTEAIDHQKLTNEQIAHSNNPSQENAQIDISNKNKQQKKQNIIQQTILKQQQKQTIIKKSALIQEKIPKKNISINQLIKATDKQIQSKQQEKMKKQQHQEKQQHYPKTDKKHRNTHLHIKQPQTTSKPIQQYSQTITNNKKTQKQALPHVLHTQTIEAISKRKKQNNHKKVVQEENYVLYLLIFCIAWTIVGYLLYRIFINIQTYW